MLSPGERGKAPERQTFRNPLGRAAPGGAQRVGSARATTAGSGVFPGPGRRRRRSPVTLPSQAVRASAPQAHYREPRLPRRLGAAQLRSPRARARAHPLPGPAPHLIHLGGAPSPRRVPPPPLARHVSRAQPHSRTAAARGWQARASARAHARASGLAHAP